MVVCLFLVVGGAGFFWVLVDGGRFILGAGGYILGGGG